MSDLIERVTQAMRNVSPSTPEDVCVRMARAAIDELEKPSPLGLKCIEYARQWQAAQDRLPLHRTLD